MQLPLACASVIQKTIVLVRAWLLQHETPPFFDTTIAPFASRVSADATFTQLFSFCTAFFASPYLAVCGDRLPAAISVTRAILALIGELVNPAIARLASEPSPRVWSDALRRLTLATARCAHRADAFGSAASGAATRTLLTAVVFVRVVRDVDAVDAQWDALWSVFEETAWTQVVEQVSERGRGSERASFMNASNCSGHDLSTF